MQKLKERWGVNSNWDILLIIIVFCITGSAATKLAGPIIEYFGVHYETSPWYLYWGVRILLIFPTYQFLLVCFGWLFGQSKFFWAFEKKMLNRIGILKLIRAIR